MAKKSILGLGLFFNNKTNSGIVNYIFNIVAALKTLPQEKQPQIIFFHSEDAALETIKELEYNSIRFICVTNFPTNFFWRKLNSFFLKVTKVNLYQKFRYGSLKVDAFYPYFPFVNENLKHLHNKIEWLVDFNNKAFPQFYHDNGAFYERYQSELTSTSKKITLSSYTLLDELKQYYPNYMNDVKILRFACTLPSLKGLEIDAIKKKYKISVPYFMSPNQFWEHKNQIVVLKAIQLFKEQYPLLKFKILFTGSLEVNRGKGKYAETLVNYIEEHKLTDCIQFMGILERKEQLMLMKHSIALIQPSLYEGWSTLVEEAKALNKFIVLSNLPVHKEQIEQNVAFFNPFNEEELSDLMYQCLNNQFVEQPNDYKKYIRRYADELINVLLND